MQSSENINELAAALAKAQGQMAGAAKNSTNPHFRSTFADLAAVVAAVRDPLSSNGIAFLQMPQVKDGEVGVSTRLVHSSGQWIQSTLWAKPRDMKPQSIGSCITYLKRYGLQAMCGVPSEDDDGNAAQGPRTGGGVRVEFAEPMRGTRGETISEITRLWKSTQAMPLQHWLGEMNEPGLQQWGDGALRKLLSDLQEGCPIPGADPVSLGEVAP